MSFSFRPFGSDLILLSSLPVLALPIRSTTSTRRRPSSPRRFVLFQVAPRFDRLRLDASTFELIILAFQNTSLSDSLAFSQREAQEATSNCCEVKKLNETLSKELVRVRQEARLERKGEKKAKDWFEEKACNLCCFFRSIEEQWPDPVALTLYLQLQEATSATETAEAQLATLQGTYNELLASVSTFNSLRSPFPSLSMTVRRSSRSTLADFDSRFAPSLRSLSIKLSSPTDHLPPSNSSSNKSNLCFLRTKNSTGLSTISPASHDRKTRRLSGTRKRVFQGWVC